MGLGLVELTLDVEQRYGILIPNDEASRIETPGQLANLVEARLRGDEIDALDAARATLQHHLAEVTQGRISDLGIEPDRWRVPTVRFISVRELRRLRQSFIDAGLNAPPLQRPAWLRWSLRALWPTLLACAVSVSIRLDPSWSLVPVGLLLGVSVSTLFSFAARRLRHEPPVDWERLEGIVAWLASRGTSLIPPDLRVAAEEVWPEIQKMVADAAGLKPEQVQRDDHFVRDLRMG